MALMLGKLHEALLEAGTSPEKAREAAEEAASYETRLASIERKLDVLNARVTAIGGIAIALLIAVAARVFTMPLA